MSNTIGRLFTATTFGESHGAALGVVVDGCPAGVRLVEADIQAQLDRRRPGRSPLASARKEADKVEVLSGIQDGLALGSPIAMIVRNSDARSKDYAELKRAPRPSHADFTYKLKYGVVASSGGGRSSARETVARVAAGVVAECFLAQRHGVSVVAWVSKVGSVDAPDLTRSTLTRAAVDGSDVRCPDAGSAAAMSEEIRMAAADRDSVGGVVTCVCRGVPAGLGEPVFGKIGAMLAGAMLSIPAARGFEVGIGFAAAGMRGSANNDVFVRRKGGGIRPGSNRSGGVLGGITSGEPLVFRVAFKPAPSIAREQGTVDYQGKALDLRCVGRHDPCVVPRAVPVVEAMAALVLADAALLARATSATER